MQEREVYSLIGAEGFTRLVAAFYRQVPQDDLLGIMYPAQDLSGAEQRLRDFLAHLGVTRANALQARTSQGADADAARVRALSAHKDFHAPGKMPTPTSPS
jgi:hypothetical protein